MKQYFLSNKEKEIHLVFEHPIRKQGETDVHDVLGRSNFVKVEAFNNVEFTVSDYRINNNITYTLSENEKRFYSIDREGLYSYKTRSESDHIILANGEKVQGKIYLRSAHVLPEPQAN